MGRHQRAETSGLISFLICAVVGAVSMNLYMTYASPIWQLTQRRFMVCAGIVAACGVFSFIIGYGRKSRSLNLRHGWFAPIRRVFEIASLSVVYAATIFLSSFALVGVANDMKTIAGLLPFFVVSGVATAGMTTDDPYWYLNNFSQLGDRSTFAARMFNSTLILAGSCIIIVSYFAISELVATERLRRLWHDRTKSDPNRGYEIPHFAARIAVLSLLLTVSGLAFIGIGVFRYTPHHILHNVCAKGLPAVMLLLFGLLPWLAPRLSKAVMVASDLTALVCAAFWANMMLGHNTLTNVEALAGMAFLGWFIVFSRQIAAIEADRVAAQLLHAQAIEGGFEQPHDEPDQQIESRIAADR
ncbi:MAG: ABC transporter permease [Bifidobacterium longum]|nr:ABC transporter permease [Bifidobacterium longum]